ncbi:MAG: response regulator transcription factor [Bdellovibrionales bacterium]|nr:response regulator transcription factor [Bdellovibrionales bacterium]
MKAKILVIEDNADTRKFLQVMLSREFEVAIARDGIEGIELAKSLQPELIVLDVVMPSLNGYDTCKRLKSIPETENIPVIFLSGKNTTAEITYGISMGADDYLPKPFDHKELLARIKTRLARSLSNPAPKVVVGKLEIDTLQRVAHYERSPVSLTLTEFDILRLLAARFGVVVSREEIMREIWKDSASETTDRTIDVHIRSLRKKIPAMNNHIQSVYGVGYKYVP